ncbi:hypothetical protein EYE42_04205 [Paracoccus subflavus]|uniref:Uncharacterized protein n=1 Tax=Paracoccus subflavus TaxID=2528244 RepID=A0A4Q9G927_9RHOB|nr:hypothetical protein [Paracoccus subflavus]TBN42632.1 hypothetical protein EYE42_04205 [Paracoccus subflavus]
MKNGTTIAAVADKRWSFSLSAVLGIFDRRVTRGLLLVDVLLILVHVGVGVATVAGVIGKSPNALRIDRDWGIGETTNYVKWLFLIGIALALNSRRKQPVFLGIALLGLLALLDDSLQLHEYFGDVIAPSLFPELPLGIGEIMFMAMEGIIIVLAFAYGWKHSSPSARSQMVPLLLLFGGMIFCGVVIDFLHTYTPGATRLEDLMAILEDGGEMIFLSLMVGYAAGLPSRQPRTT